MTAIKIRMILVLIIGSILFTGCTKETNALKKEELHVAAAANLKFAFDEIGKLFEHEFNCKVIFQFGSTGNLSQQIINGAPIDIFAPVSESFINELISSGDMIENTKTLYAIGRIVLVINENIDIEIKGLEDLLIDEIDSIAMANPNHAPYGVAAKEALESLGIWEKVEHKIVYGENIAQVMEFVQTGNVAVGITALSLVDERTEYILIGEKLHNPLKQTIGVVSRSKKQELGNEFIKFLKSSEGEVILEKYGYSLP